MGLWWRGPERWAISCRTEKSRCSESMSKEWRSVPRPQLPLFPQLSSLWGLLEIPQFNRPQSPQTVSASSEKRDLVPRQSVLHQEGRHLLDLGCTLPHLGNQLLLSFQCCGLFQRQQCHMLCAVPQMCWCTQAFSPLLLISMCRERQLGPYVLKSHGPTSGEPRSATTSRRTLVEEVTRLHAHPFISGQHQSSTLTASPEKDLQGAGALLLPGRYSGQLPAPHLPREGGAAESGASGFLLRHTVQRESPGTAHLHADRIENPADMNPALPQET